MMQSRAGFSFLEILIVTAISALLAGVLFSSFWQTQRLEQVITDIVSDDQNITRLYNQFEKDVNGFFVPALNLVPPEKGKKPEAEKEQQKRISKVFASTSKNKMLNLLTFTTDNVLSVYKKEKPLVARVVYRLEPSKKFEGTFALTRQEFGTLDAQAMEDKNKPPQAYIIADSISSLVLTYIYTEVEPAKEEKQEQRPSHLSGVALPALPSDKGVAKSEPKKEETKKEVKKVTEWDSDAIEKDKESKQPLIPDTISMQLTLRNVQKETTTQFTFIFPLLVAKGVEQRRKAKPEAPQPPAQPTPPGQPKQQVPPGGAMPGQPAVPGVPMPKSPLIITGKPIGR